VGTPQRSHAPGRDTLLLTLILHLAQVKEATINRRRFITTALGVGALAQISACTADKGQPRSTAYRGPRPKSPYKFSDEFDGPAGSAPDLSKWQYDIGGGGWGNGELEFYTSSRENSFLDGNGNLVIRATKEVHTEGGQTTTAYRSARLNTMGKFSAYHGTFEARMKLDVQPGLWPAWWALGANFPQVGWPACGEVDMLESFGVNQVQTSVHTPSGSQGGVLTKSSSVAVDNDWHTWRMEWGAASGGFTFLKDGAEYMNVLPAQVRNWVFSSGVPLFLILNLAVGGVVGTPPESVQFPVDLLVDYVRVW